jgi:hypothetical protein
VKDGGALGSGDVCGWDVRAQGLNNAVVYQLASAGQQPAKRVFKHPCIPLGLHPSTLPPLYTMISNQRHV